MLSHWLRCPEQPVGVGAQDNYLSFRIPARSMEVGFGDAHHCDFWDRLDDGR